MKNFLPFFLIFLLILSSCSGSESSSSTATEIYSSSLPKNEVSAPKTESSGYENPYTSCVPEWSASLPESDSSYVHSTDSSSYETEKELIKIKGRTTEIYPAEEENLEFVLGTFAELERWKSAINNLSNVSEIVICYIETEERKLDFYEVTNVINCLRAVSPDIKTEEDNPATGGSFTVYAYDSEGKLLWWVSPDYWFTLHFAGENTVYILDSEGADVSVIQGLLNYRRSMSQP